MCYRGVQPRRSYWWVCRPTGSPSSWRQPPSLPLVKGANATAAPPFPLTARQGFIGYNEACWILGHEDGWKIFWDQESSTPYAVKGRRVISYDNKESIKAKLGLAEELELGGAMVYTLDTDDFSGRCGERYPLLATAARRICNSSNVRNATIFSHTATSL